MLDVAAYPKSIYTALIAVFYIASLGMLLALVFVFALRSIGSNGKLLAEAIEVMRPGLIEALEFFRLYLNRLRFPKNGEQ